MKIPEYEVITCPTCGQHLRRETLTYYFDETMFPYGDYNKDMGESGYYCPTCNHTMTIVHDLNNADRANLRWKDMIF